MATTETWVLDGVTLTSGNFDILDLKVDPPKARPDWLTAADSESAVLMRQPLHENREITMTLRVAQQASMNAALDQVGVILDKLYRASATPDGVALVWTPANSTRSVTFDVLAGEIPELPIGLADHAWSWFKQRPIFTIVMTCEPYWRGTETLTSTASSSTPITTLEVANVTGDVPALGRLIVTDTATQSRKHFEWGMESPTTYNSGTSLIIDSDSLVTSGFAGTGNTRTGAYDPNATGNNVIRSAYYGQIVVAICGTGAQSHIGSFRVKARVFSNSTNIWFRFGWQVGDGSTARNQWIATIIDGQWNELDLGTIVVPPVLTGTQKWSGFIEVMAAGGGTGVSTDNVDVDYFLLVPVDAGYGKARAPFSPQSGVTQTFDDFSSTTAGGALSGRTPIVGAAWVTAGSPTDFAFVDGPNLYEESVTRSAVSDTGYGRFATAGGSVTNTDISVNVARNVVGSNANFELGLVARYVDISNYLSAYVWWNATTSPAAPYWQFEIHINIAGTATVLRTYRLASFGGTQWSRLRLLVFASGRFHAELFDSTGAFVTALDGYDVRLATGGTLATGKVGIRDRSAGATSVLRYYDNFQAVTPVAEPAVIYSGRSAQVRYDDTIRQDSTGVYNGRPESYRGTRFLLPPGTSRVLAKARRNDIETIADDAVTDATQIQVGWTPRGLAVPR